MSPVEGEEPTTATAVEPETPQLGEQPAPIAEAVPAAEQEQPEGEQPEGDSETQPPEDEAPADAAAARKQFLAQLNELREADPELDKEIRGEDSGPERAEELQRERDALDQKAAELDQKESGGLTQQFASAATSNAASIAGLIDQAAKGAIAASRKAVESADNEATIMDQPKLSAEVATYVNYAINNAQSYGWRTATDQLIAGIQSHPLFRRLPAEARKTWRDAAAGNNPFQEGVGTAVQGVLDALATAGPDVAKVRTEIRKELEGEMGVVERYENLMKTLPKRNGTRATTEPAGPTISNIDDAEEAYNDGKLSHEQYKKLREKFGVKDR